MKLTKWSSSVLVTVAASTLALGLFQAPALAGPAPLTPPCHNDTTMPNNFINGSALSGDPNIGLKAGSSSTPGGYYYLDLTACGSTVTFTVATEGCWHFQFFDGIDHHSPQITHFNMMENGFTYTFTHAVKGHVYAARLDNMDPVVVTDHSTIDSY